MNQTSGALGVIIENNVAIPMRDGIVLRANIFRPDGPGRFPALVHRTPYGKKNNGVEDFVRAGYVVVSQDFRGRYASDGVFTVFSEEDTKDGEDGYDTVEWAAEQPWCDGKIGSFGVSYDAWAQYQMARLRPPHLVAMNAISIPLELTDVDWPGVFKPARRVHWWLNAMAPDLRRRACSPPPHTSAEATKIWNDLENGRMLGLLPWIRVAQYLPSPLAEQVADWLRHPNRRPWKFNDAHKEIDVPNLDFTGWFDHCCGVDHFSGMRKNARSETAREHTKVILGPWNHSNIGKSEQANFSFGPNAKMNITQTQILWFDYWLKGIANGMDREPPVRYFVLGSEKWKTSETWPPKNLNQHILHLASDGDANLPNGSGKLELEQRDDDATDTFTSDPFNPVPTLWDEKCFHNVSDRHRLDHRTDILRYRTAPLNEDLEVVGHPEVVLHASCSAPDADVFVRLSDEPPDGPAMEICHGMVRARHRHGLDEEALLTPGEVTRFRVRLGATACRFRKGHQIRLDVCASDFPNYDRNHHTGGNDLLETEMTTADITVHHSPKHPSTLILPVNLDT